MSRARFIYPGVLLIGSVLIMIVSWDGIQKDARIRDLETTVDAQAAFIHALSDENQGLLAKLGAEQR